MNLKELFGTTVPAVHTRVYDEWPVHWVITDEPNVYCVAGHRGLCPDQSASYVRGVLANLHPLGLCVDPNLYIAFMALGFNFAPVKMPAGKTIEETLTEDFMQGLTERLVGVLEEGPPKLPTIH